MYFGGFEGKRTAYVVFDMPDSFDMVPFAEPFFQALRAAAPLVALLFAASDRSRTIGAVGARERLSNQVRKRCRMPDAPAEEGTCSKGTCSRGTSR